MNLRRTISNVSLRYLSSKGSQSIPCTMVSGDGVGPELSNSVEKLFDALNVPIEFEKIASIEGEKGLNEAMSSIRKNRIALLSTIGRLSVSAENVTHSNIRLRQNLDLYANVVHAKSFDGIPYRHQGIDIYLMREHTEGEYSTLEQEIVKGVVECLKITTKYKSRRIAKFAFDFALKHNRKLVTAVHKANIIKLGDGLFLRCCEEISKLYPRIKFTNMIIDNATMQMTSRPQQFDVIVMQNLYGSILDNICSGLTGGAGVTPGASYSSHLAVFQPGARHTFCDGKGKNIANPLAMILCSANLLQHVNLHRFANAIRDAVSIVLKEGKTKTTDLGGTASTDEFTLEIIKNAKSMLN